jgi:hypothetical protein
MIAHGVRWHDATTVACELGCELLLEVPLGHVLTDLARENLRGVQARAVTAGTSIDSSILQGAENWGKVLRSTWTCVEARLSNDLRANDLNSTPARN